MFPVLISACLLLLFCLFSHLTSPPTLLLSSLKLLSSSHGCTAAENISTATILRGIIGMCSILRIKSKINNCRLPESWLFVVEDMASSLHVAQQFSVGNCSRFTLEMALLIELFLRVSYTPQKSLTECLVRCFNCWALVNWHGGKWKNWATGD